MSKTKPLSRSYLIVERESNLTLSNHPDHLTIQPFNHSTISIQQIRDLIHWAYLKPFSKKEKAALIGQAQKMTTEAQSALLKLLEEPPAQTIIILTVDDEKNLLPTVVSRCLRIGGHRTEDKELILEDRRLKTDLLPVFGPPPSVLEHPSSALRLPSSISESFQLAESLAKKERDEIIETLNAWTISLRQSLLKNPNAVILDQIKKIKYTQKVLQANANKRLALENLFLSLK